MGIPQGYLSWMVLREWMGTFVLEVFLIGSWVTAMEETHKKLKKASNNLQQHQQQQQQQQQI